MPKLCSQSVVHETPGIDEGIEIVGRHAYVLTRFLRQGEIGCRAVIGHMTSRPDRVVIQRIDDEGRADRVRRIEGDSTAKRGHFARIQIGPRDDVL